MTAIERTAYPQLRYDLTAVEIAQAYTPTETELAFVKEHTRQAAPRISLLLTLKCVQHLGYFPKLSNVPVVIRHFICDALQLPRLLFPIVETKMSRHRNQQIIRRFLHLKSYTEDGIPLIKVAITKAAQTMSDPADLINVAIEQLYNHRVELPAYSTLDRYVNYLRTRVHEQLFERILAQLTPQQCKQLDTLLRVPPEEHISPFNRLKETPGSAKLTNVRLWEQRFDWLNTLLDAEPFLEGLAHTKIKQFASEAQQLELGDMRRTQEGKRYLLLLCFLYTSRAAAYDELTTMFLQRLRAIHRNAKNKLQKLREEYLASTVKIATAMHEIAQHAQETEDNQELGGQVRQVLDDHGGAAQLAEHSSMVAAYHSNNHLPLMWGCYHTNRALLFRLMDQLTIRTATQDTQVISALAFLQQYQNSRRQYLPVDISLDFASKRWQQLVKTRHKQQLVFSRKQLEVCIFNYVAVGLSRGDLFVEGSEAYADYRKQLLSWEECQPRVVAYCEALGLSATAPEFVKALRERLETTANRVDATFPVNSDLTLTADGHPHLKRAPGRKKPGDLEDFRLAVKKHLPERHLLDMLKYAHHRISYTRHFGPPSGHNPKLADATRKYLMAIFGYGCGLGAKQTAQHTRGIVTRHGMKRINDQHVTTAKLEAATRDIINEYARFQLPFLWGDGKHAVADGTHIKLLDNNLLGQHHFRYGEYGAIAYHHVSDTYIAIFSHFIACGVWEAVYILDGLLKNESAIQPDTLHADTQGQSASVFGLSHLLGIRLMPRMRNWNKVDLCRPSATASYEHINALFNATTNWALIEKHWQDLMQVVLSIQAGKVLPSMLLQKLGSHNRGNKLYQAFNELGRVMRTIFLLEYLSDMTLRQSIQTATTVVERYNDFLDWLSFGGDGVIRVNDPVEQEKRIKYLNLVANTVMLQNVIDITIAISNVADEDFSVTKELVSHLSPYMTQHIKRFGEYILEMDDPAETLSPDNDFLSTLR